MVLSRLARLGTIHNVKSIIGLRQVQSLLPSAVAAQIPCLSGDAQYRTLPRQIWSSKVTESLKDFSTGASPAILEDKNYEINSISEKIQMQIQQHDVGRLFAVVHLDGKQRKITTEDIIILNKHIPADIGERILLNKVLMVGSKDFSIIGRPLVSADVVQIEATVLEKTLSYTRVFFRYLRRQNNKKMRLQKDSLTYLRINAIRLDPKNKHLH